MAKFSVKKPLTVLVAVIVAVVLGVVSYLKMTPDLLPNIDMPYVVVVTTYAGASPEKVETVVTRPMEQSMASLENIKSIQSSSSENVSMLMMEFAEDANLDAISVDILQNISMIEGAWDEMVGTPIILKINPSMLPVMVAAVSMDGMDNAELSAFLEDSLMQKLEGTLGVASISASGLLEENFAVTLKEEKIEALNEKVQNAIEEKFTEGEEEIDKAKEELESGEAQLEAGKEELAQQMGTAGVTLTQQQKELEEGKKELKAQLELLKEQLAELKKNEGELSSLCENIQMLEASEQELTQTVSMLEGLNTQLPALEAAEAEFAAAETAIKENEMMTAEQKEAALQALYGSAEYRQVMGALLMIDQKLAAAGLTRADVPTALAQAKEGLLQVQGGLSSIDAALAEMGLARADASASLLEVQGGIAQLEAVIANLEATLATLESGEAQLSEGMAQLESSKIDAIFQLSDTTTQLLLGKQQLESGEAQLDSAKESALKGADLSAILTKDMVKNLLVAQNFDMPAGSVNGEEGTLTVTVGDGIGSLKELEELILLDLGLEGIEPIRLQDVADITVEDNSASIYAKIDGNDGVMLTFSKQSTASTAEVSDALQKTFDELEGEFAGLSFVPLMDQGDYIHLIVNSILQNILLGALFAVLILLFFLKDLKPTLITLCSIPLSLVAAIVCMYFSGVTLNMLSLSGLAVAVGMLVDNSVVVIENIYRLRAQGVSAVRSAVFGAKQVTGAIAASTVTTICVFLPIVFVEGLTKQLFTDMALTITFSLLASLAVALTLVPAMSAKLLKNYKEKAHPHFDKMIALYERSLRFTLHHKAAALILAVVLLGASTFAAFSRGLSFMPPMGSNQISVTMEMPEDAAFEEITEAADRVQEKILAVEGIGTVGAMTSGSDALSMLSGGSSAVSMYIMLDEETKRSSTEIAEEINEVCAELPFKVVATDGSQMDSAMTMMTGSGVSLNLYGTDLDVLTEAAKDAAELLSQVEGTAEVSDGIGKTDPELHFTVDKEKAAEKGLTVAQVYAEVAAALAGGSEATTLTEDGRVYSVKVYDGENAEFTDKDLRELTFTVTSQTTGETQEVKLADIAEIEETETMASISRIDQRRYLTVTAKVAEGYNVSLVTEEAEKLFESFEAPKGVTVEFAGENEAIMEAMEQLLLMLLLGILLVYLVMVAQFQSLKSPFIVMFTIPLAFTGGMAALYFLGMTVSVISLVGFVMLCGIIVNNGIVLVDYINQLRIAGRERVEAIVESGKIRMRPILMTSVTTILGMLVTAVSGGEGAAMIRPIAVVCIGGLIYATLMTLYIVPVIYDLFNKKEMKVVRDEELLEGDDITDETVI